MNTRHRLIGAVAIATMAFPPIAGAQNDEQRKDIAVLDEIIVTAQKREQRLIDVPMAITALDGLELEQRGFSSIQDIAFAVPGLALREDGPGSYSIFMRGISNQYGPGALVGVYLDESPVSITGYDQLDIRVMDLARVEVLKGPQGTLYGQGSVAGTVRYITRDPLMNVLNGSLEGEFGSVTDGETKRGLTAIVNLPVAKDKLALRFAGAWESGGGWIDQPEAGIQDGNGSDLLNLRLKGLWQINDSARASFMVVKHSLETQLGLGYEQPDRTVLVGIDRSRELLPKDFEYLLTNATLDIDLGFASLVSSTTYIDHDHQYPFSYVGGEDTIYGGNGFLEGTDDRFVDAEQLSQEIRLVSTEGSRFNWTVGGFYREAEKSLFAVFDTLFAGVVYPGGEYRDVVTYESFAVFAEGSYRLTDRLETGVGVRYFNDDQENFDGSSSESDSFDSIDPRIWLSYALTDSANIYASVAQGFRSGGFNRGDAPNYEPEELTSYEIGIKASLASGRVGIESAVFYTEYSDMLRRGLLFVDNAFQSLTSNIGDVEVTGFEAGITLRPSDNLRLNATLATLDSEVVEVRADDATNIAGDPVDYSPDLSYTLGARYDFNWVGDHPGFARIDYSYRDRVSYIDRSSFPDENLPQWSDDIGLLDARIGAILGRYSVEVFGQNLTNENKYIDPYHAWTNANRTRPRMIGVTARINFE